MEYEIKISAILSIYATWLPKRLEDALGAERGQILRSTPRRCEAVSNTLTRPIGAVLRLPMSANGG